MLLAKKKRAGQKNSEIDKREKIMKKNDKHQGRKFEKLH